MFACLTSGRNFRDLGFSQAKASIARRQEFGGMGDSGMSCMFFLTEQGSQPSAQLINTNLLECRLLYHDTIRFTLISLHSLRL